MLFRSHFISIFCIACKYENYYQMLLRLFGNLQVWFGKCVEKLHGHFCRDKKTDQHSTRQFIGPIKVNLEFSFSFTGVSFSGLDPNIYSGFKPKIHFICQFQFSQQLLIVSLCFSTWLSSQKVLSFFTQVSGSAILNYVFQIILLLSS